MSLHNRFSSSLVSTPRQMGTGRLLVLTALVLCASCGWAQQSAQTPAPQVQQPQAGSVAMLMVPSGTLIQMVLVRHVSTKSTKPGDTVYLQTTFPVIVGDKLVIPAGTFLEGSLASFKRQKGRVELRMQSAALIFSNGYKAPLPGPPEMEPGHDADVRTQPGHPTAAAATYTGAIGGGEAIGAIAGGTKGAITGGAIAGPVGFVLAVILIHQGSNIQIEAGSPVEITLERPLLLDELQVSEAAHQTNRLLAATRPKAAPSPKAQPTMGTCFTPDVPGTPPTIIPGAPGSGPTVIPGTPTIHGTPYPCPQ